MPDELVGRVWKGKWRGQRQMWFLYRFNGLDNDIDIATEHEEFKEWMWVDPATLPEIIVAFKAPLYRQILDMFADHLR